MNSVLDALHAVARISVEQMLYCLVEGTLLACLVGLLLRMLPRRNSGTRFVVWFSALLAMLLLPFLSGAAKTAMVNSTQSSTAKPALVIASSWSLSIFGAWAAIAALALLRVAVGMWQLRRLRRNCTEIPLIELDPSIRAMLQEFQQWRPVSLCVSDEVQVPTAVGFSKPAVVVPAWLLKEVGTAELKQVLFHELTHLRRRDDWSNLVQKIVKALLFFHPSVWWIESRLSLEREMACDDAVLARTANARDYAQCLTRMAEKSFLRRQVILAQAAVNRMRQLSLRVAQILDANRPGSTKLWWPAVPLVMVVASICVVPGRHASSLIVFEDDAQPAVSASNSSTVPMRHDMQPVNPALESKAAMPKMVLAKAEVPAPTHSMPKAKRAPRPRMLQATNRVPAGNYLIQQQTIIVTQQGVWQVRTWEVHVILPANQLPRKST
ncbi:MAG: hypothetical protein DMG65_12765 [Candidatus Angelobacter sp. Gp1-AA117]|nr:MAG: hypothetical protein DMG65_12765 [Candidatus Angelobacter sp. Gp1-AA117]